VTSNGERRRSIWKWARRLAVVISLLAVATWLGVVIYLLGWYVPGVLVRHKADASVEVAWIGAIATVLGVAATAAVAIFAFWYARSTNQATIKDQGKQLDRTLEAQRKQTNKTLKAQRKQLDSTLTRTLNERFATAAGQLGSDKPPMVRLAGVYAMAGLADDWPENRQTCVDVLCGYLRMPYEPDPGQDAPEPKRLAFQAIREVRHTVIRVITAHLQKNKDAATSWQGLNFDFTGAVFDGGDFAGAVFSSGEVSFVGAVFSGGMVDFERAVFSGGTVRFAHAVFTGGTVDFSDAWDWSFPPEFPWTDTPPPGVKLPKKEDQSQA
jgi:Pentapeptide repeats (9 copies)